MSHVRMNLKYKMSNSICYDVFQFTNFMIDGRIDDKIFFKNLTFNSYMFYIISKRKIFFEYKSNLKIVPKIIFFFGCEKDNGANM